MLREVLISPTESGFAAVVLGLPDSAVEAPTRDEVIEKAKAEVENLLARSEIVQIEVNGQAKSQSSEKRKSFAGMWAKDETFDDFLAAMKAYRAELNNNPDQL